MSFQAAVMIVCACGWLMQENESGRYCGNPICVLNTRLYKVGVTVEEVPLPTGAAA